MGLAGKAISPPNTPTTTSLSYWFRHMGEWWEILGNTSVIGGYSVSSISDPFLTDILWMMTDIFLWLLYFNRLDPVPLQRLVSDFRTHTGFISIMNSLSWKVGTQTSLSPIQCQKIDVVPSERVINYFWVGRPSRSMAYWGKRIYAILGHWFWNSMKMVQ